MLGRTGGEGVMTQFLYGMWFMWFCLCVVARSQMNMEQFLIVAVGVPGLLVMVGRDIWFLVRLVKFKWERRR